MLFTPTQLTCDVAEISVIASPSGSVSLATTLTVALWQMPPVPKSGWVTGGWLAAADALIVAVALPGVPTLAPEEGLDRLMLKFSAPSAIPSSIVGTDTMRLV